jgi:hypothetical protein
MAKPLLTNADFCRAAKRLRCEVAAVKAVAEVESRGAGFYSNGFPTILFERHVFRKYTDGKYNKSHPHLSGPAGNYGKAGQNQRNKFNEAYALDPIAAIKACSWGKFQVMGFNWKVAGYSGVVDFFNAMQRDEGEHLNAFIGFVIGNHLDDEIRHKDWAGFAYGYNGSGYKANKYDTAMARAYVKFAKENIDCSKVSAAPMPVPQDDQGELSPALADPQAVQPDPPPINVETTSTTVEAGGQKATETVTTATTSEPVTVKAVAVGIWSKVVAGLGAVTALGINAGTAIETKLSEISLNQVFIAALGIALLIVVIFYIKKRQEAADAKTALLIAAAADKDRHTIRLTK